MPPGILTALGPVLAQAGGGSAGFSGGGGGGFGGGGGSGGSSVPGGLDTEAGLVFFVLTLLILGFPGIFLVLYRFGIVLVGHAARRRSRRRERDVAGALREAAEEDPAFDADAVRAEAAALVVATQAAWDARDEDALAELVGEDLLVEWRIRLKDFARSRSHSRVLVTGEPVVRVVGATNRGGPDDRRVVVHFHVPTRIWLVRADGTKAFREGRRREEMLLSQYWTLGRRGDRWILLSIEEDGEGEHHLTDPVIPSPAHDEALRDLARAELAVAGAPRAAAVAALRPATLAAGARATALDLALADDRFSPDVLASQARAAVRAWVEAIDGPDAELERRADRAVVRDLLFPDRHDVDSRVVLRGPLVEEVEIEEVLGDADPPRVRVRVAYRARWYREDRRTQAVLAGSRTTESRREQRLVLALDDDPGDPDVVWRIVET